MPASHLQQDRPMRYELHYLKEGTRQTAHLVACHDEEAALIAGVFLFYARVEYGQLYSVRPYLSQKRRTSIGTCWAEPPKDYPNSVPLRIEV